MCFCIFNSILRGIYMERKLNSFVVSVFVICLLCLSFLPLCLLWGAYVNHGARRSADLPKSTSPTDVDVDSTRESCILLETHDRGTEYIDKIIFLGESTTYGLWRYGVLSEGLETTRVWTGATEANGVLQCAGTLSLSPTIDQTLIYYPREKNALTISQAIEKERPEYIVITLGLNNGASYYSEDQFKQCYRILLNAVKLASSQDTKILLQSVFPVAKTCQISAYTPQRIQLCNSWIVDLAAEYELKYLDTFTSLSDENGYLLSEYDNGGDGIHLNENGLNQVLLYIRTHGYPEDEI